VTDAPAPFAHVLHRRTILALAGTPIFARGHRYYREGRVEGLARSDGRLTARVRGSEPYDVAIWVRGDGLAYACSCPFAAEGAFCKHCVATALAWLDRCAADREHAHEPARAHVDLSGNLLADLPERLDDELATELAAAPGARVERIVSTGHASPPGFWYDQPAHEWVALLRGEASLRFEDEPAPRTLRPGDWLFIEAHRRHRVERTAAREPTVWLAVHLDADEPAR
jgi:cupin 2 domain-containing protein